MQYVSLRFGNYRELPNFNNMDTWRCFYEIYGYSPRFIGDRWKYVNQLLQTHPDKLIKSNEPAVIAIFSCIERKLDGVTNTFVDAKKDWHKTTCSLDEFQY